MKITRLLTVLMLAHCATRSFATDREVVQVNHIAPVYAQAALSDNTSPAHDYAEPVSYQLSSYSSSAPQQTVSASYDYANTIAPTASGCVSCEPTYCECSPWWAHKSGAYGELLMLLPGDTNTIYAVEQTGIVPNSSPTGPVGFTRVREQLGFRVGLSQRLTDKSSLVASFAKWDGSSFNTITANNPNVLNSTIIHPSTATVGAGSLTANARQRLGFTVVDTMLRRVYRASDCGILNWNLGVRYGYLKQGFTANQTVAVANGTTTVDTNTKFNGFGIAGGFDGERRSAETGFLVYGRALGSLLAGTWRSTYRQNTQFNPGVIGNNFEDFRVSPVVDTELGFGWRSAGGGLRVTSGYLFSTWFHAVNNRDYIQAVRDSRLLGIDQSLTFSGLTLRAELQF